MKSVPKDMILYEKVKNKIYNKYPQHSAYRSGLLVKDYKKEYYKKYKSNEAYYGTKKKTEGLTRWFKEEWKNQRNEIGYKKKGDIYRPTKRITNKGPLTYDELTKKKIKKAIKNKKKHGRINRFRNN